MKRYSTLTSSDLAILMKGDEPISLTGNHQGVLYQNIFSIRLSYDLTKKQDYDSHIKDALRKYGLYTSLILVNNTDKTLQALLCLTGSIEGRDDIKKFQRGIEYAFSPNEVIKSPFECTINPLVEEIVENFYFDNDIIQAKASCNSIIVRRDSFKTRNIMPSQPINNGSSIKLVRYYNFRLLSQNCMIFNDLVNKKSLEYNQVYGLATHLYRVEGGLKTLKNLMEDGNQRYYDDFLGILPLIRKTKPEPIPFKDFSPYISDWEIENIEKAGKYSRVGFTKIGNRESIDIEQAEEMLNGFCNEIEQAQEGQFLVIAPAGLGKTTKISKWEDCVIACNSNGNKNELAKKMGSNAIATPDYPVFSDSVNKGLKFFLNAGYSEKAIEYITSVSNGFEEATVQDMAKAKAYLMSLKETKVGKYSNLITTKQRAVRMEKGERDILVFDECPLSEIVKIDSIKLSDISALVNVTDGVINSQLRKLEDYIRELSNGQVSCLEKYDLDKENILNALKECDMPVNIIDFLNCKRFVKDPFRRNSIHFVNLHIDEVSKYKKIAIFSASASPTAYKLLFPNIKIMEMPNVKHKGQVLQYNEFNTSRRGMKYSADIISSLVGDDKVITFKDSKKHFKNPLPLHFGNCASTNEYEGNDISVVGTTHLPNYTYLLTAEALDMKLTEDDCKMSYRRTERNGYGFKINTFAGEQLSRLQMDMIEAETIQSVGRGRTIRNECTVKVFTNMPMRYASI